MKIKQFFWIMLIVLLGLPLSMHAQSKTYKTAVPVIDVIEQERPEADETMGKKPLEEPEKIPIYFLSREFLAALLSFLILFLALYIYLKYIRKVPKIKIKYKKQSHSTKKKQHVTAFQKSSKHSFAKPEMQKEKDKMHQEKVEVPAIPKSDEEAFQFQADESDEEIQLNEAEQLKSKRIEHSRRINKLLGKL